MKDDDKMKKSILIVDDETEIAAILSQRLELKGFRTKTAQSGNEAYEILRGEVFDLIISDIRMPNGDGVSLLKRLRADGNRTPLLFVTGFADIEKEEAIRLGASDLLAKPMTGADLFEAVRKILL